MTEVRYLPEVLNSWSRNLNHFPMLSSVYCQFYTSFLEKAMAPHSNTLAWKIPWMEEPGRLQSMWSLRVGLDWVTSLSLFREGNGNPLQCSCLENPRERGAWWAAVYGVTQSWTRLKWLSSSSSSLPSWASQVALVVKNLSASAGDIETPVWSLVQEDPLEEGMQPTPVFLPGESHGQKSLKKKKKKIKKSLEGYSPWGHKETDQTEAT